MSIAGDSGQSRNNMAHESSLTSVSPLLGHKTIIEQVYEPSRMFLPSRSTLNLHFTFMQDPVSSAYFRQKSDKHT